MNIVGVSRRSLLKYLGSAAAAVCSTAKMHAAWLPFPEGERANAEFAKQSRGHAAPTQFQLHSGWDLQSSSKVTQGGDVLSMAKFRPRGWFATKVPSTVFAAEVKNEEFKAPFVGMNLRQIPGMSYPIGENFANLPMPKDSPYACSWWYRTEFRVPRNYEGRTVWLHFEGINCHANIWLNGHRLVDAKDVNGAYRIYEFEATSLLLQEQLNALAVETFAQTEKDLGLNFVDWNPTPPDKNMGLWKGVYLTASGPVTVRSPHVVTHFPDDSLRSADLLVMAELHNTSDRPVEGVLEGSFGDREFRQNVALSPGEKRSVRFEPDRFAQLRVSNPDVWWPAPLGPQNLHSLTMRFLIAGTLSDEQHIRFGIREITAEMNGPAPQIGEISHIGSGKLVDTDTRPLLFRVNHRKILIRGAGWTPDMLFEVPRENLNTQLEYVRHMNLNAIRLEGKLVGDDIFDLADEKGILIMAGWCCCSHWEKWDTWAPGDLEIATRSLRDQILRLRTHPSLMLWLNGSDFPPPANVEQAYIEVLKETAWPNPYTSSASAMPTTVSGASGVKMTGPYDYVPPSYWLTDKTYGGAFGFNTETSPGPAIPLKSSLQKMIPADHLWPIDDVWNYHAGAGPEFHDLKHYTSAMTEIYGAPTGLDDYITKSQAMAYDGERAMFEAFARNKYSSTGVIQWMLNNAWPSVVWHLYDYFLQPAGGYFGARKACESLHVQYSYDDRSVVVVNNLYQDFTGLTVTAALYDFDLKPLFTRQDKLDSSADSVQKIMTIPPPPAPAFSFVKLSLEDAGSKVVSSNFYWLPSKLSTFDWEHTHDYYTPLSNSEDLKALNQLPPVRLEVSAALEHNAQGKSARVRIHNPSQHLAFQIRLGIHQGTSEDEILPVFWEDNYLALLPGESNVVTAHYSAPNALTGSPQLKVQGWNIEPITIALSASGNEAT
jgi:exo-1,4-beta-D-glucosaminidase